MKRFPLCSYVMALGTVFLLLSFNTSLVSGLQKNSSNTLTSVQAPGNKPKKLPSIIPPKTSGIDWSATNKLRYYVDFELNMYNGKNKELFDSYLLDLVNKKTTSDKVIRLVKPMKWQEQWLYKGNGNPGVVTYIVNYCDTRRIDIKYNDKTKDAQLMLSSAIFTGKIPSGKYEQVVAYYNAAAKTYSLYFLGIDFMYSNPEVLPNQHKYSQEDLKAAGDLTTIEGLLYKQLAPGTKTNLYWIMFKDEAGKIYIVNGLGSYEGDALETCMNKTVKITGKAAKYPEWPGNTLDVKIMKLSDSSVN